MNKIGLIIVVLAVGIVAMFALGANKKPNENVTPASTANQPTEAEKKIEEATITVTSSGFDPQNLTIKSGTKVVWINKSGAMTTVNSAQHPTHLVYPALNLNEFADGSSVSLVFEKPGEYKYHDHLNPTRFGSIMVE